MSLFSHLVCFGGVKADRNSLEKQLGQYHPTLCFLPNEKLHSGDGDSVYFHMNIRQIIDYQSLRCCLQTQFYCAEN